MPHFHNFQAEKEISLQHNSVLNVRLFKVAFDCCLYLKMQCVTGHNIFNSTFSVGISSLAHIQDRIENFSVPDLLR